MKRTSLDQLYANATSADLQNFGSKAQHSTAQLCNFVYHPATMDKRVVRRAFQLRGIVWPASAYPTTSRFARHTIRPHSTAQNITSSSFWKSLVPKPLRRENRVHAPKKAWLSKEWNPATFYIVIFLMIGSMSIQMISLRKNFEAYMRRSEVRIGLLREVVDKLQKGEQVDVEKVLGTGDAEREAEWEQGRFKLATTLYGSG